MMHRWYGRTFRVERFFGKWAVFVIGFKNKHGVEVPMFKTRWRCRAWKVARLAAEKYKGRAELVLRRDFYESYEG